MNDPHVNALIYRVLHDERVKYAPTAALEHDGSTFKVTIKDEVARFDLKQHFDNVEDARATIEPAIRSWELAANLDANPGDFELKYTRADIIDRAPTPGIVEVQLTSVVAVGATCSMIVEKGSYPSPDFGLGVNVDVEAMQARWVNYRREKDTLPGIAYFCLTVFEDAAGGRANAANKYNVANAVLSKLGHLTGEKGGTNARKARGRTAPYTDKEHQWVVTTVRALIRRLAEVDHDPTQALPQITLADLPNL